MTDMWPILADQVTHLLTFKILKSIHLKQNMYIFQLEKIFTGTELLLVECKWYRLKLSINIHLLLWENIGTMVYKQVYSYFEIQYLFPQWETKVIPDDPPHTWSKDIPKHL